MGSKMQRVGIGVGAFHNPPRAKYSEETRDLIKVLMEESKLTMMQRKSIQDAVDRGEPLPAHPTRPKLKPKLTEAQVTFPSAWKRRSQELIIDSGAYDREQFRRTAPLPNKEKQKRHLACIMAYGKDMPPTPHGPQILHKARREIKIPDDVDPFQELVKGIQERIEFLNEMEGLGQGKKYRPIIQQEVMQKIRLIEKLDNRKSAEIEKIIGKFEREIPMPKPYPLGELQDA